MKYDTIIGIDPGASGGIAEYRKGVKVIKMTKDVRIFSEYLHHIKEVSENSIVFIEKVQMWFGDSSEENRGKQFRIAKMTGHYEQLKTVIELAGISYIEVAPITWQSFLRLRKKGKEKKDRKNRYKAAAAAYYPEIKVTLWNADAMCILQFGRLKLKTDIEWIQQRIKKGYL